MGTSKIFGTKAPDIPHLSKGEIKDLRDDIDEAFTALETNGGFIRTDTFVDPAVADPNAIKTAFNSSGTADQQFVVADFDGAVGAGEMVPPRNITVTTALDAGIDAVAVVITGKVRNEAGELVDQTETITLTDGGGQTDAGAKPFSLVTQVDIPQQSGEAQMEIGFGAIIGLSALMLERAGTIIPLQEIESSTGVVTTGTFTNETDSAVTSYDPGTPPDDSEDYSVTYVVS